MFPDASGATLNTSLCLPIADESQVGYARRTAMLMAQDLGFTEVEAGKVAIIVSEAARNQLRYSQGGFILLRSLPTVSNRSGIEVLALDSGPGMADIPASLRDGYSTGGTSGTGLGAIKRLATQFDIFSHPNQGTAILAQCFPEKETYSSSSGQAEELLIGAVNLPVRGETACGDAWASHNKNGLDIFMVCDGLGHGPSAAKASETALMAFEHTMAVGSVYHGPAQIIEAAHRIMRSTRGAAVAVTELDRIRSTVRFAGIGNIGASLHSFSEEKKMVSLSGIVGAEMRKVTEFTYPLSQNALLIMHSDGLQTHWSLSQFPGIMTRHPSLIAGVLYRDFNRGRDDVTVLVAGQK